MGCQDTYIRYNVEMETQRQLLNEFSIKKLRNYKGSGWSLTTAPRDGLIDEIDRGDEYYNYAMPRNTAGTRNDSNNDCYKEINNIYYLVYGNPQERPFTAYHYNGMFPYLPGWSLQRHFEITAENDNFYTNAISAGIDCLGFVMRAAEYSGNPYYGPGRTWSDTL